MKQVFLSGKGEIEVHDVPVPGRLAGAVLVRNAFSLISSGTEGAAVSRYGGFVGVIEKAARSRERVQQVWELARTQGIPQTFDLVRRKLDEYSAPGYSSAGQVVEVAGPGLPFHPGDRVACMGTGFATHAEYVMVPAQLAAPIPAGVACDEAAFGALCCIALQGIRRLELSPGEWIGVIGLGLVGQITAQLVGALGYRGVGIDLSPARARRATELAGIAAWGSEEADSLSRVRELTSGQGLDGLVVCAASHSDGPVNLAFDLCRQRGRVSVVGDVGLGLLRAKMYAKETELRLSCSYGPGRYDESYELEGRDYPLAFARWTEGRNLQHVLALLAAGKLRLSPLASERCPVERAASGYAKLKQGNPELYGVLLDYGPLPAGPRPLSPEAFTLRHRAAPKVAAATRPRASGPVRLGLIGCGGFQKAVHLPNLRRLGDRYQLVGVTSRSGASAELLARRTGIPLATSDYRSLLAEPGLEAVLIATRHATHGQLVLDALAAGKHVFVEKPMCVSLEEGQRIVEAAERAGLLLRVGFNRRFSPAMGALRRAMGSEGPRIFSCRVNIGHLAGDWSNTVAEGGRLLGEGVHFFDLCNWFFSAEPLAVSAIAAGQPTITNPNLAVHLEYTGGGVAQVLYTSLGNRELGKEAFEAFGNQRSGRCEEHESLHVFGARGELGRRERGDKGHLGELEEFAARLRGQSCAVEGADARAGLLATWTALAAYESAASGRRIRLAEALSIRPAGEAGK